MAEAEQYGFTVDWYDAQADLMRDYNLTVWKPYRGPLEASMYDPRAKRVFLKKTALPDLRMKDLHVGSSITVYSRQLTVKSYGDEHTRQKFETSHSETSVLTSPRCFQLLGQIVSCIEAAGLSLGKFRLVNDQGPVVAMKIIGADAPNRLQSAVSGLATGCVRQVSETEIAPYFENKAKYPSTAAFDNCSLCIVRPHVLKAGQVGQVISALFDAGFELSAAKMLHLQRAEAKELFEVYHGVLPYHSTIIDTMSTAPCIAMEVRAPGVVERLRELCGPLDVDMAKHLRPQSLRALFGKSNAENGVHATDLEEDAEMEVRYVFELLEN